MPAMRPSTSRLAIVLAIAPVLLAARPALAQRGAAPGVGVELPLTDQLLQQPNGWVSFVYDTGLLHFDLLGQFVDVEDNSTLLGVGGRLYYTMHRSAAADFSIGGGLFVVHREDDATDASANDFGIELGPKIRVFLAPSVAVHSTFGLAVVLADDDSADIIGVAGRLSGSLGLTYFFR
jgi:hypothetical protein